MRDVTLLGCAGPGAMQVSCRGTAWIGDAPVVAVHNQNPDYPAIAGSLAGHLEMAWYGESLQFRL
jgi:hypothetical protein